jgi:hypothetical protein
MIEKQDKTIERKQIPQKPKIDGQLKDRIEEVAEGYAKMLSEGQKIRSSKTCCLPS